MRRFTLIALCLIASALAGCRAPPAGDADAPSGPVYNSGDKPGGGGGGGGGDSM